MTVSTTTASVQYTGTGTTSVYPYTWQIAQASDLIVYKRDTTGVGSLLVLNTDYTVSNAGSATGGNVTLVAGNLTNGWKLLIASDPAELQNVLLQQGAAFNAADIMAALDLLTRETQANRRLIGNSLQFPVAESMDALTATLPAAVSRANKTLSFDGSGNATVLSGVVVSSNVVPVETIDQIVDTIALLKALAKPATAVTYLVRGYNTAGDGGGGQFRWNSADGTTDNGGTIIQANAGGTGRWNRLQKDGLTIRHFGAVGDGVTDDTAAITRAWNFLNTDRSVTYVAQSFRSMRVPAGLYLITSALPALTNSKLAVIGEGWDVSRFLLGGNATTTYMTFGVSGSTATITYNQTLRGVGFLGTGANAKTALYVSNAWTSDFHDITIYLTGNDADVGLKYHGHTSNTFQCFSIVASRPCFLSRSNLADATDGVDHTVFRDFEIFSTTNAHPLWEVDANSTVGDTKWEGNQAWIGGSHGFYFSSAATGHNFGSLSFSNVRRESQPGPGGDQGYCIYIKPNSSQSCAGLFVNDLVTGYNTGGQILRGIYVERTSNIVVNGFIPAVGGVTMLNATALDTNSEIVLLNSPLAAADTVLSGYERIFGSSVSFDITNASRTVIYRYDGGGDFLRDAWKGNYLGDMKDWAKKYTMATGDIQTVSLGNGAQYQGMVMVTANKGVGTKEMGIFYISDGEVALLTGSTNVAATNAANKLSVYWDAGNSVIRIKNNIADTRNVIIRSVWQ